MGDKSLSETLGLQPGMRTYFAHPPTEYFEILGYRPLTFRPDDDGMYDFIHAFFEEKAQLEASAPLLTSKLADNGILWISYTGEIDKNLIDHTFPQLGLTVTNEVDSIHGWNSMQFSWK